MRGLDKKSGFLGAVVLSGAVGGLANIGMENGVRAMREGLDTVAYFFA